MSEPYHLWSAARSWADCEVETEDQFIPAIRSLFPADIPDDQQELRLDIQLIPELDQGSRVSRVSVRAAGRTVGYLDEDETSKWIAILLRIIGSGFVPTTSGRIWISEWDGWDGVEVRCSVRVCLGAPNEAIPMNEPRKAAYTMLPQSSIVQVTKEDEHFDVLSKYVPLGGYGVLFATLSENAPGGRAKPHVEVRIDNQRVGQLTPQMSQRYLPMIRHLETRGLATACWADITGSAVAAEVRIAAVKANEASTDVLDGVPITIPALTPELMDPCQYNTSPLRSLMTPLSPVPKATRPIPPEPADGSVIRFSKSKGRYNYIAVRKGSYWETTATDNWGSINEVMRWTDLATRLRDFAVVSRWDATKPQDERLRENLAVVRFSINGMYLAAIRIAGYDGQADWYTTITNEAEIQLPFGDCASWPEICKHGSHIQIADGWVSAP
ncbi:hypothetical protein CCUG62472_02708 [Mycobacteroides salmoniphilum]|nr:hypothetical protein CCUG62472_02708 [Mycobacteroides salmoniphilum]